MARIYNPLWSNDRRKELRNHATKSEKILWQYLKESQTGLKFRRQAGVGPYIVDFYCPKQKLAIELDGEIHNTPEAIAYDQVRTEYLESLDIRVLRFPNQSIFEDLDNVLLTIKAAGL